MCAHTWRAGGPSAMAQCVVHTVGRAGYNFAAICMAEMIPHSGDILYPWATKSVRYPPAPLQTPGVARNGLPFGGGETVAK